MRKLRNITLTICTLLPASVLAAFGDSKLTENKSGSLLSFLKKIQGWLVGIVGGLAILFIVYGGLLYVTSGGNKERIETAKKTLTYAVLGLILVILAGVIFGLFTGDILPGIFGTNVLS